MTGKSERCEKGSKDKRIEGRGAMDDKKRLSTPDEILDAALAKECQSRDFYSALAEQCRVDLVRQLIEKLKDEENKHVKMIEAMMTSLRLGRSPG
jgi:rubrerythrin